MLVSYHNHAQIEDTKIVYVEIDWLDTASRKKIRITVIPGNLGDLIMSLQERTQNLTDIFKVAHLFTNHLGHEEIFNVERIGSRLNSPNLKSRQNMNTNFQIQPKMIS